MYFYQADFEVTWEQILTVIHCTASCSRKVRLYYQNNKKKFQWYGWCHNIDQVFLISGANEHEKIKQVSNMNTDINTSPLTILLANLFQLPCSNRVHCFFCILKICKFTIESVHTEISLK